MRLKYNINQIGMDEYSEGQSGQEDYEFTGLFSKLVPVVQQKVTKIKAASLNRLINYKENKKKKVQARKRQALKKENYQRNSRSPSGQRSRDKVKKQVRQKKEQQRQQQNLIVISDDESLEGRDCFKSEFMSLNWKQRRKLNRLFERQQRNYRLGKQKDSLSFTIFNTIESYFR